MEKDHSFVNLDDDRDITFDAGGSSDESGDEHDKDFDHKEAENLDASDLHYKSILELTSDDILGLEFGSEEEGCQFYHTYARLHGFVVRKHNVRRDLKGDVRMRQLVCSKAGLREKKHFMRVDRIRELRPITRTQCKAKIRIYQDYKTSKWKVVSFEESHNHELTPAKFSHLMPAYRVMTDADKSQVDSLHSFGVRTCHIMGYLVSQKGGYAGVGFTKKDLYNYLDRQKRSKIKDGDVRVALSYLQGKADNDPMFFSKYTTTTDGRLQHLFWADGASIADFQCFGDVLAFDTTYKKNKYNHPLVIFSGCNHHSQTILFGCALVTDETVQTYKWVLETFLEAMCNKHPKAVVTDGDMAMREAIKQVFPDACHRLCAWHLHNNACENIKNSPFLEDFKRAMYANFTMDEFEDYWKKIVAKHGLTGNKWVCKTYDNKSMWATAYLRDKFFGRIRTTSQCEAINSMVKTYVRKKNIIVEFMHNYEQALREYRNNELNADYKTLFTELALTTSLYKIEAEASKIYTHEIFKEVKHEIERCGALNVADRSESGENLVLRVNKYGKPDTETIVVYDKVSCKFRCDCLLFESRGIPCSHIFCAIRHEHMDCIPPNLICKRWTKRAKIDLMDSSQLEEMNIDIMTVARFGSLAAACNSLCQIASKNNEFFHEVRDEILKLKNKFEKQGDKRSTRSSDVNDVGDPTIVKTKGAPVKKKYGKKRRRCTNCNGTGHIIRTCPRLLGKKDSCKEDLCSNDEELSPSEPIGLSKKLDSDKEGTRCDESNAQQTKFTNQSTSHKDNVENVRHGGSCKTNRKKIKCSTQNSVPDHNKEAIPPSSGRTVEIQQGLSVLTPPTSQNVAFGYGPLSQGVPMYPMYGSYGAYGPQIPQVPLFPHIPKYLSGMQDARGMSCNALLQEVIKKGNQLVTSSVSMPSGDKRVQQ